MCCCGFAEFLDWNIFFFLFFVNCSILSGKFNINLRWPSQNLKTSTLSYTVFTIECLLSLTMYIWFAWQFCIIRLPNTVWHLIFNICFIYVYLRISIQFVCVDSVNKTNLTNKVQMKWIVMKMTFSMDISFYPDVQNP